MDELLTINPTEKKTAYIMESLDEIKRLEMKTGFEALKDQALWAGLRPGMRVADIGCGSGITASFLKELTGGEGEVTGIDQSRERIDYARKNYGREGILFVERDIYSPLTDLGKFDFIWVRFLLEYHRTSQYELVSRFSDLLAPGGIICLIDLDFNSFNHHGWSSRLKKAVEANVAVLEKHCDFDPYAGKRLYGHLYDLEMKNIQVRVDIHNLIYGELKEDDAFNWMKKVEVACRESGYTYPDYPGGFDEFYQECLDFIFNPRRFTYTPMILCRGEC